MSLFRRKALQDADIEHSQLARCLSGFDLMLLGIGGIIGAGIFVLTGIVAATQTGPGIVFSYIMAGLACAFSALAYAELAAMIGGCGSAYGYAYVGFGELIAWIVGWDLMLEYAISVSTVSVGWSGYFSDLLRSINIHIPESLRLAPAVGGMCNLLSMCVILLLTALLAYGVKSSARANNIMVAVKLAVIMLFIVIATSNFDIRNWSPFMPFGWEGVMNGASLIFFAYVGFDAVSTTAEEAINPQRDLPRGIVGSLLFCTSLYMIVSGLLTGMIPYPQLNVASPISHALLEVGYHFAGALVSVGAVAGLTTVMLVLFLGLSRVFLAMSRDGLLPGYFSSTHPKTKTPARIILLCGITMSIIAAFVPINDLAELVNIGTLFAFIIVCSGVIALRYKEPKLARPFKTPLMPIVPLLGIACSLYLVAHLPWFTMMRFAVWMAVGILIYFVYSRKRSKLQLMEVGA